MNFKITEDAARQIRLGQTGTATWVDYLGNTVLGAYQAMPVEGLTLIGKIKEEEVLAPVYAQLAVMIGCILLLVVLLLPLAALLTSRIKQPVEWLIQQSYLVATEQYYLVGTGQCPHKMPHELGNLCETFIRMSLKIGDSVNLLKENEAKLAGKVVEIQDINATLEEEIMERILAQEALRQLNGVLETRVAERTWELQDLNATLEEEIMERQTDQESLNQLNAALEIKVQERTRELEEEIRERLAVEKALLATNDALISSEGRYRSLV